MINKLKDFGVSEKTIGLGWAESLSLAVTQEIWDYKLNVFGGDFSKGS